MTDVVELIVAEHRRIRRLFAALDHADQGHFVRGR
jgi:hypothetical protein